MHRAISVFVCLLLLSQAPARGAVQSDAVKELATRLAALETEEERAALLARGQASVTPELVTALNAEGVRLLNQREPARALDAHKLALGLAERLGFKAGVAFSLINIGNVHARAGANPTAAESFLKAAEAAEAAGDVRARALAHTRLGDTYRIMGEFDRALEHHQKSLKLHEQSGNKAGIAMATSQIGFNYKFKGEQAPAIEFLERGLGLQTELGNKVGMAFALVNLSDLDLLSGDAERATERAGRALQLYEEAGDKAGAARTLAGLGLISGKLGDYTKALEHFQKALAGQQGVGDKVGIANRLLNIGDIYLAQGSYARALESLQEALKLNEELGNRAGVANSLHSMGIVYYRQGDYAHALEYYEKVLKLREAIGNKSKIAGTLNNIAILHSENKEYALALDLYQKSMALQAEAGVHQGVFIALGNIGSLYRKQGEYERARDFFQQALSLSDKVARRYHASIIGDIGETHRLQGNHERALEFAARAADIARQTGYREVLWATLFTAGQSYRSLGRLEEARRALEEAVDIVESIRAGIAGDESRANYFTSAQQLYEVYVDVLMQMHKRRPAEGHDLSAFRVSERARARSLLETLSESRADVRQGVDAALLGRERVLQLRLNSAAERRTHLLSGKHTEEQAAAAKREVDEAAARLQELRSKIHLKSPRYAALTQPSALGVKEIQTLLDKDTLLLEYALGEERSYLWAVTPTSVASFELPRRVEMEKAVRGVYDLMSDSRRWEKGGDAAAARYAEEAGRLSRLLLGPVAAQLKGKRLVVVGDGALQYLPFGALPSPVRAAVPLVAENEVVSLPSASTVAVLRQEGPGRARASKAVAVIADPVFEPTDTRLAGVAARGSGDAPKANTAGGGQTQAAFARRQVTRTLPAGVRAEGDGQSISRLAFTYREAKAILANAPEGERFEALGFDASRETATSPALAQYRIIHFATHGVLDSEHPELSGVVLSLLDRAGNPVDGYLRLHEIYNLNLPADLVVLSACQTALGKDVRGEGLVGLTRGFMYAGSPRVVASLWRVNDAATADLMGRFYRGMLKEKMRPAAALRAAQVEMLRQPRFRAPYYWAAFQLQGEWR